MEVASFLSKKAKSIHIVGKSSVPFEQTLGLDFGKKVKEVNLKKKINNFLKINSYYCHIFSFMKAKILNFAILS